MMSHAFCFSAVLLLWLLVFTTALHNKAIGTSCLTTTDTKTRLDLLRSYDIQRRPLHSVEAVRFHTKKGKTICSDLSSPWAKKAMKFLDERKKSRSRANIPTNTPSSNATTAQTDMRSTNHPM